MYSSMLRAIRLKRGVLLYKCVQFCVQFCVEPNTSRSVKHWQLWKKFNFPKWKWTDCCCTISHSLTVTHKGDATPNRQMCPVLWHCYQTVASDARVVLLIETSSQVHRGQCNWLTTEVHSVCMQTVCGREPLCAVQCRGNRTAQIRSDVRHLMDNLMFCWPRISVQILGDNNQLDALLHVQGGPKVRIQVYCILLLDHLVFIYFIYLHVSSVTALIIRRSNFINTSSGTITVYRHTKQSLTQTNHTRWCINTIRSPDDEHCEAWNM